MKTLWKWILPALSLPLLGASDLFIFRGDFIYLLPSEIGSQMVKYANRGSWRHFPEYTRYIDEDRDGRDDYVAIAAGAAGGYGLQLRYRLRRQANGTLLLGRWYWFIITDNSGETVIEKFNP